MMNEMCLQMVFESTSEIGDLDESPDGTRETKGGLMSTDAAFCILQLLSLHPKGNKLSSIHWYLDGVCNQKYKFVTD